MEHRGSPSLPAALAAGLLFLAGCGQKEALYVYKPDSAVHSHFSGERALREVATFVEAGPHPAGTEASLAYLAHLETALSRAGWNTTRQHFEDRTPIGKIHFTNLRARFPATPSRQDADWERGQHVLLASHFDTKYYKDIHFVGANDGGSSTGALIEIARCLALNPALATQVELVFFDGEEAYLQFTATDGLYGSRHYASQLRAKNRSSWPAAMVLLDLIGDHSLNVRVPPNGSADLLGKLYAAARDLDTRTYFGQARQPITDDHVPFNHLRIPAINIIDLDYAHWHRQTDTLDKISPQSLEIVGRTTLLLIEKYILAIDPGS